MTKTARFMGPNFRYAGAIPNEEALAMNTAYYTFSTWSNSAMAAGFDAAAGGERQAAMVRQSGQGSRARGGDNVIDLNAWRAANLDLLEQDAGDGEMEWTGGEPEELELRVPAPRPRKSRRAAFVAELASTAGVAAAALAIILRVVAF